LLPGDSAASFQQRPLETENGLQSSLLASLSGLVSWESWRPRCFPEYGVWEERPSLTGALLELHREHMTQAV
jgi:hypothetical protein